MAASVDARPRRRLGAAVDARGRGGRTRRHRGVLDTNATLTSALALYRAAGWVEVPAYNDNDEATHWFAKDLTGAARRHEQHA